MDTVEFWEGKSMLFLRATGALVGTQEALPKSLDDEDRRRLGEVAEIFSEGTAWLRDQGRMFTTKSLDAFGLLTKFAQLKRCGTRAQIEYFQGVQKVVDTIQLMLQQKNPEPVAVAEAARYCEEMGEFIFQLECNKSQDESNDD